MGTRSGKDYLDGLTGDREVWLGGERIKDVANDPRTAGAATMLARLYDLQFDHPEKLLRLDPVSGEQVPVTHLIPRSAADLATRHDALACIAGNWS
ncbi:4-hydroxyphenylacetate 3-hydroxylase N-terminal domain-containing protein, partial [Candidatus Frankia nodulisporulans]